MKARIATLAVLLAAMAALPQTASATRLYLSHFDVGTDGALSALNVAPNGALTKVTGSPFAVGQGLRGLVLTPDARYLYSADSVDEVHGFSIGPTGAPSALSGSPFLAGKQPNHVAISPDGRFLYATNTEGGADPLGHSISSYSIGADGKLTSLGPVTPSLGNPRSPVVVRGGRFLFFLADETLRGFPIQPNGTLGAELPPTPFFDSQRLVASTDGTRIYGTNDDADRVHGFSVSDTGIVGPLPSSPYQTGADPEEITVSPDGRYLFVGRSTSATSGIDSFAIAADGSLTPKTGLPTGWDIRGVAVSPDSRFVYGSDSQSPAKVWAASIAADGSLTALPISPFDTGGVQTSGQAATFAPAQAPFAAGRASTKARRAVAFDARASSDPDGTPTRYDWAFGDGGVLPNGGPTPTHTYASDGPYVATLTITDNDGCSVNQVYNGRQTLCNGKPSARTTIAARADGTAPRISRLKVGKRKRKKSKVTFRLSEAGTVTVKLERRGTGRKVGKKCVKPTRKNRSRRRCVRYTRVGSKKLKGRAGANKFTIGKKFGRRVTKGRYRLTLTAADAAGNKSTARKAFRVR